MTQCVGSHNTNLGCVKGVVRSGSPLVMFYEGPYYKEGGYNCHGNHGSSITNSGLLQMEIKIHPEIHPIQSNWMLHPSLKYSHDSKRIMTIKRVSKARSRLVIMVTAVLRVSNYLFTEPIMTHMKCLNYSER